MKNTDPIDDPATEKIQDIPLLPQPTVEQLNQRQQIDYAEERRDLINWLLNIGKDPEKAEGYAATTVKPRTYRMDNFYRWVWEYEDGYTTDLTTDHADRFTEELKYSDKSNVHKNNCLKALKMLYKWRAHERGGQSWDSEMTFKTERSSPKDFLRKKERQKIRQASLEYGTIPSYNNCSPEERERWRRYLAQRFEKPKEDVTKQDWERANGWKIPSLVYVSLDAGLRPVEVRNATVDWVDLDNGELRITKEDSAKNRDNWNPVLREKTQQILRRWMRERMNYDRYEDSDHLWLTREGNPYQSGSLKYILTQLAEEAGLDTENRSFHWYMIRHSTGTYTTHEISRKAAQAQLRHKSAKSTDQYDQAPPEIRREGLDKIG